MLNKVIEIGVIEILTDRQMQVREDTVIYEDSIELSRTYTRYVVEPGDDVSDKPQLIQDLANLLWTPEVVSAWKIKRTELARTRDTV